MYLCFTSLSVSVSLFYVSHAFTTRAIISLSQVLSDAGREPSLVIQAVPARSCRYDDTFEF